MTGSNTPKVSVCIPAFNAAEYLRQAVESALVQSYRDFEIVIVDNCSTDQTGVLVDEMLKKSDGLIRYYKNDRNIGLVGNFNRCMEYARGTYIKFLCADDILLPGCIEQMAATLESHPSVKLVASARLAIDEHGNELAVKRYINEDVLVYGDRVITRCLFGGNYIGEPSAVMFRKSDLKAGFREDLPQLSDMEMWFQLLEQGDLLNIKNPLCAIRLHPAQMTHVNVMAGKIVEDNIKIFDMYSRKPYIKATQVLTLKHKLLMSFRIWISRGCISDEMKNQAITRYASRVAYALMPAVWHALILKRRVLGFGLEVCRRRFQWAVRCRRS